MTQSVGQLARRSFLQQIVGAIGTAAIICARLNAANAAIKISPEGGRLSGSSGGRQAVREVRAVPGTKRVQDGGRPD